jgi:hypothetical protein
LQFIQIYFHHLNYIIIQMLPKNLLYTSRIESAPARASRVNIAPQNGTGPYNLGDTIIFNIPTRPNLVLVPSESYLKFNLQPLTPAATGLNAFRLDSSGAHQFIQAIRIYHGSNLLQNIDNYGMVAKMLYDLSVPTDAILGKLNVMSGTRSDFSANVSAAAIGQFPVTSINSGELLVKGSGAAGINFAANETTQTYTYCLNLVSLLGTLCPNNYFPLFMLSGAPLRMEIQLTDLLIKAMNVTAAPTLASGFISNVEYIANFIELGDMAMSTIMSSLNGAPLQFVFSDYRNYQYNYALPTATTTQVQMPIPAKFSSLKSLFISIRDKGTGALTFFPGSSVGYGLTDYQFRIGPNVMPPKTINTYQEMFSECVKAIGSMSDINYQPSIDKGSYTMQQSTANTTGAETYFSSGTNSGSFYIGLDLENYANADKSQIFSGANTNTDDIYAIMNFTTGALPTATLRFDAFAMFDSVVVFENNTAYIRF